MADTRNTTDARVASTTRRSMLGMIAGVPVATAFAAIPVEAMASGRFDLERKISAYHAIRIEETVYPKGMTDIVAEEFGERRLRLFRAVVDTPASDIEGLACKLDTFALEYDGDDVPHDDMMSILTDLRRLAAH